MIRKAENKMREIQVDATGSRDPRSRRFWQSAVKLDPR